VNEAAATCREPERALEVREQLEFETLLTDLSARFGNLAADQVDSEIEGAQQRICAYLGIDHSTVWQSLPGKPETMILTHLYREPRIPAPRRRIDGQRYFPWSYGRLKRKEIVCVASSADLPPEAATDRATWKQSGIKSTLAFPLWTGDDSILGVLAFDATNEEREWPEMLVKRLQLLAQVIANALARKRAEQAIRESEERFRLLTDTAPTMIWMSGTNKHCNFFNQGWLRFTGRSIDQEMGEGWAAGVHRDDLRRCVETYSTAFDARVEFRMEYRLRRFDGEFRWILDCGAPRFETDGSFVGYIGSCVDITESKGAQEALQKSFAQVKELKERLQAESDYLQEEINVIGRYDEIVGRSGALMQVLKKVEQVAGTDSAVLITGESGTGKELVARAIHNWSKRRDRVMVKVDCASLPSTLIESELFGREKGAYTGALTKQIGRFETADSSTLFLDEIGEFGVEVQAKLLRVAQDGEFERLGSAKTNRVNVRLIAATNRDLVERVKIGLFREDLYYRLNVFPIHLPPLRERTEDIPLLVMSFIREFEKKMGKKIRNVPNRIMEELRLYPWPGNIRELRNVIERAVIVTSGEKLYLQLPKILNAAPTRTLKQAEYQHILSALEKTGWRIKGPRGAANILGVKPSTLYGTMRRLQIPARPEKGGIPS
jgi:PAS domain S-box-containing protein